MAWYQTMLDHSYDPSGGEKARRHSSTRLKLEKLDKLMNPAIRFACSLLCRGGFFKYTTFPILSASTVEDFFPAM